MVELSGYCSQSDLQHLAVTLDDGVSAKRANTKTPQSWLKAEKFPCRFSYLRA